MSKVQQDIKKINHWRSIYDNKYLGSWDIENARPIVTIQKMYIEEVTRQGGDKSMCWVAKYAEFEKPMIINKTNAERIQKMYETAKPGNWIGKRVQIYVDKKVRRQSETIEGLRIVQRIPPPPSEAEKDNIKAKIRPLLSQNKTHPFVQALIAELTTKQEEQTDSIQYLNEVLKQLQNFKNQKANA